MRFIYTKAFAIFSVCVVVLFLFVLMQTKGWLDPIRRIFLAVPRPIIYVVNGATKPVKGFFSSIYGLNKIASDNTSLHQQVIDLQQQLADLQLEKRENEALRKELGFVSAAKYSLAPCTVLAHNPFGLTDTLVLNCGAEKGVSEGQVVISQGYVVGKIIYAGQGNSTVLLATSSKFFTDAELSKTGADAMVSGSFGAGLLLDRLSQNENVESGWLVTTAGINSQIPKGILIGQVGQVISSSNDLFKKTTLLSPVDFNSLDFVFAVKP